MGADLLMVVLPGNEPRVHDAINAATTVHLAEYLLGCDEFDAVWDAITPTCNGGEDCRDDLWRLFGLDADDAAVVDRELRTQPDVEVAIRQFLHTTAADDGGRAGVHLRLLGVDLLITGGMSWGDDPYDGFSAHCSLGHFLDCVGKGVPTEVPA